MGFEFKVKEYRQSKYASEKKTMMDVVYNCVFFVAVKVEKPPTKKQGPEQGQA